MRTSCIQHPAQHRLVILRQWHVDMLGNAVEGALLSFFEYWHNIKLGSISQSKSDDGVSQADSLFQHHTESELEIGILGIAKKTRIKSALASLQEKGLITIGKNPSKRYKFDRTNHYLFHVEAAQKLADRWCEKPEFSDQPDTADGVTANQILHQPDMADGEARYGGTIPKTSSKTSTPKISTERKKEKEREEKNSFFDGEGSASKNQVPTRKLTKNWDEGNTQTRKPTTQKSSLRKMHDHYAQAATPKNMPWRNGSGPNSYDQEFIDYWLASYAPTLPNPDERRYTAQDAKLWLSRTASDEARYEKACILHEGFLLAKSAAAESGDSAPVVTLANAWSYPDRLPETDEDSQKLAGQIAIGRTNWRHEDLDNFEPLPWAYKSVEDCVNLKLPPHEKAAPQGASQVFFAKMETDLSYRDQASNFASNLAAAIKFEREGRSSAADDLLANLYGFGYQRIDKKLGWVNPHKNPYMQELLGEFSSLFEALVKKKMPKTSEIYRQMQAAQSAA